MFILINKDLEQQCRLINVGACNQIFQDDTYVHFVFTNEEILKIEFQDSDFAYKALSKIISSLDSGKNLIQL